MEKPEMRRNVERAPHTSVSHEKQEETLKDISFHVQKDGEPVGSVTLYVGKRPFPHYYIANLTVFDSERGSGYGSELMDKAEAHIRASGVTGLLVDDINPSSPASGMYRRRGWELVPGTEETYYFNLQEGQDPTLLRGAF